MAALKLQGTITKEGELIVELPPGYTPGTVNVRVEIEESLPTSELGNGAKIAEWLRANPPKVDWVDAEDAAEYIHNLRRQSRFDADDV